MNLNSLLFNLETVRKIQTVHTANEMECLELLYLKPLFVVASVMLKEPHLEHMVSMWVELPNGNSNATILPVLAKIFNTSNIEPSDLSAKFQTQIATCAFKNKPLPWLKITTATLHAFIKNKRTTSEAKQLAQLALEWIKDGEKELYGTDWPLTITISNRMSFFVVDYAKDIRTQLGRK